MASPRLPRNDKQLRFPFCFQPLLPHISANPSVSPFRRHRCDGPADFQSSTHTRRSFLRSVCLVLERSRPLLEPFHPHTPYLYSSPPDETRALATMSGSSYIDWSKTTKSGNYHGSTSFATFMIIGRTCWLPSSAPRDAGSS